MMAAAAKLSAHDPFVQRCTKCHDAATRLAWGCDGPTAVDLAVVDMTCILCRGQNDNCSECSGSGRMQIRDCPWRRIEPKHSHAIDSALQLESGVLPGTGAWQDQAATFVQAFPLLVGEVSGYRQAAMKRAQDDANRRARR